MHRRQFKQVCFSLLAEVGKDTDAEHPWYRLCLEVSSAHNWNLQLARESQTQTRHTGFMRIRDRGIIHIFPKSVHIAYFSAQTATFSISICWFYANVRTWPNSAHFHSIFRHATVRVFWKKLPQKIGMPNERNKAKIALQITFQCQTLH